MVIKLLTGDLNWGLVFLGLGIGDLNLQSPILKTPIPNSKSPIGHFHRLLISTFSSLLLFPKDFKNLKRLDIGLHEVGAKRQLNGVRKCYGQTDKQKYV